MIKVIVLMMLFFCSNIALTQEYEVCNKLDCIDDDFKNKNYIKYYNILNEALIDARGCKDTKKLDDILEFTLKIKSVAPRERMAKFIEREFINNPACFLSAIKRISREARLKTVLYLSKPTYINGKKINDILDKYREQYPTEIQLIFKEKALLKMRK